MTTEWISVGADGLGGTMLLTVQPSSEEPCTVNNAPRRPTLSALQLAILETLAERCDWDRDYRGAINIAAWTVAIKGERQDVPQVFRDLECLDLVKRAEGDWVTTLDLTRAAYRRYKGLDRGLYPSGRSKVERDPTPTPAFRASMSRALKTLGSHGYVERLMKAPQTRRTKRVRRGRAVQAIRPTLAGIVAMLRFTVADEYDGVAVPKEPGFWQRGRWSNWMGRRWRTDPNGPQRRWVRQPSWGDWAKDERHCPAYRCTNPIEWYDPRNGRGYCQYHGSKDDDDDPAEIDRLHAEGERRTDELAREFDALEEYRKQWQREHAGGEAEVSA